MSRVLDVLATGPSVLVQDPGRPGLAHLGVPRSGWLDDPAARLANRLVGNPEDAAVLECVLGGLRARAGAAVTVAVTGASGPVAAGGRPVPRGAAVSLAAGHELALGVPSAGLRSYVAVAGGFEVDPVLGSRATDTLAGIGPAPVAPGDRLPVGPRPGHPSPAEVAPPAQRGGAVLGLWPGPRADWFTWESLRALAEETYRVAADSDRVALRLDGRALTRCVDGELPSEGLVLGSVQVPAEGRPLVFLHDHPTTGGYPVVAVVDPADLSRCAQLRPGDEISFRWRSAPGSGG